MIVDHAATCAAAIVAAGATVGFGAADSVVVRGWPRSRLTDDAAIDCAARARARRE